MLNEFDVRHLQSLGDDEAAQHTRHLIERLSSRLESQSAKLESQSAKLEAQAVQLKFEKARNTALSIEVARLKQWRFGKSSESMDAHQGELFDAKTLVALKEESQAEDRAQDEARAPKATKRQAKRQALPSQLERIEHHYEIEPAQCDQGHPLKRIGEEVSEQLDCKPAKFFVHRHIRGKYACACCQTVLAASMPAQIIDKGIPAPGLLAQVIVAKHDDHLPLYRQEEIYRRSGAFVARSSMASWIGQCGVALEPLVQALREHVLAQGVLHADETPIKLLDPGAGKTHQAYAWVYRTSDLCTSDKAVIYQFARSRAGEHARHMLQDFRGSLITDDYSGYKALFREGAIQEAGCWAHARRKFFEAHKLNQSELALQALQTIAQLYVIEAEVKDSPEDERLRIRQQKSRPLLDEFKAWLQATRQTLFNADVTAKAIDYTLNRWVALCAHLSHAGIGVDNNPAENAIRPLALGRNNANGSLMRTRLRRRAIPPSVEAPTASLLLRIITAIVGTASTPLAGGTELA